MRAGARCGDAVAGVTAGRVGQGDVELGRDAGVESPASYRDGEGILGHLAARLDALVAQDAARVVADVAVVVVLHRLSDRLGPRAIGGVVLAGPGAIPIPRALRPPPRPHPPLARFL